MTGHLLLRLQLLPGHLLLCGLLLGVLFGTRTCCACICCCCSASVPCPSGRFLELFPWRGGRYCTGMATEAFGSLDGNVAAGGTAGGVAT